MAFTFLRPGFRIPYLNESGSTIASEDVVVLNTGATGKIGVAEDDIEDDGVGTVVISGVHTLPKTAAQAYVPGTPLYWASGALTSTVGTNTPAGWAVAAAAADDTTAEVLLNGIPGPNSGGY